MNTESILESMLFISGEPMSFRNLSKYTSIDKEDLKLAAENLAKRYNEQGSGLRILIKDNEVQMVTATENSKIIEIFTKADMEGELSRAAVEVLSVVAYRGPIARSKIEEIRGVNCSFTLRHLLIRGLVERTDNPSDARTYLYRISFDFLKKLGVEKVEDLPRFNELRNKKILEERFVEKEEAREENAPKEMEESVQNGESSAIEIDGSPDENPVKNTAENQNNIEEPLNNVDESAVSNKINSEASNTIINN